tara:strand:+ start:561 stop:710 length:150 start_codon:yes stop_codon:yes gene_type:complete
MEKYLKNYKKRRTLKILFLSFFMICFKYKNIKSFKNKRNNYWILDHNDY